ncbi:MAG: hypothetical protein LBR24_01310 [Methanobrevibacter sp.]|jgi:predicted outer membrane repeat protein|nr:hypothetical protein [Methanobrevibacter sp.]
MLMKKTALILLILLPLALLSITGSVVSATSYDVSGTSFTDIQDSVTSASNGDTINLGSKTYVNTDGKAITINKDNLILQGSDSMATLDAKSLNRSLVITGSNVILRNIIFKNGKMNEGGGAIRVESKITVENCQFTSNHGDSGGAIIFIDNSGGSKIINSKFTSNRCDVIGANAFAEGGAITIRSPNVEITGCEFTSNVGHTRAGAIAVSEDGQNAVIKNCKFTSNSAPIGGAISIYGTGAKIIDSNFTSHKISSNGGAIFSGVPFTINGSILNSNSGANGGAIYSTGAITIIKTSFSSNSATNGGAIYSTSSLALSGSSFSSNKATNGGAIYSTASLTISGTSFSSNSATNGGAIYTSSATTLNGNSKFDGNIANYGSGIYTKGTLTVSSTSFTNNKASTKMVADLPEGIKYGNFKLRLTLTKNDNYLDAVYSTGKVSYNGKVQSANNYLSGVNVVLNGASGKTNSKGEFITYATTRFNKYYGLSSKSNTKTLTISGSFAGNNLYKSSSDKRTVAGKVISNSILSYHNIKVTKNTTSYFMIKADGWYKKVDNKWKKISTKGKNIGTWYKYDEKTKKYVKSSAYTKDSSKTTVYFMREAVISYFRPHVKSNLGIQYTFNGKKYSLSQKMFI